MADAAAGNLQLEMIPPTPALMSRPTSKVFYAPSDNPEMDAAMANARATFKYLWRELTWEYRRIVPALQIAAVKTAFTDEGSEPDDVEHMWLNDIEFNGDKITATLVNHPNQVTSVRQGDRVTIATEDVEDWMYAMRGRVYGGFTIQAMRAHMGAGERRAHDEAWGFDFGDPSQTLLVPDWNTPAQKPGLLNRLFRSQPPTSTATDPTAEHPMSENMAPEFAKAIDQNRAAYLEHTDGQGLTPLHTFALGGSAACVRVLLEKGADPHRRTHSGKTPRDFAERMDWPRVVELLREAELRGKA